MTIKNTLDSQKHGLERILLHNLHFLKTLVLLTPGKFALIKTAAVAFKLILVELRKGVENVTSIPADGLVFEREPP